MNFINTHNARLAEAIHEPFLLTHEEEDCLCQDILDQLDVQDALHTGRVSLQTLEH